VEPVSDRDLTFMDRVARLKALPHRPVASHLWPNCQCATVFLWLSGSGWRCLTCDPPPVSINPLRIRGVKTIA
jgi:hypothetical protein